MLKSISRYLFDKKNITELCVHIPTHTHKSQTTSILLHRNHHWKKVVDLCWIALHFLLILQNFSLWFGCSLPLFFPYQKVVSYLSRSTCKSNDDDIHRQCIICKKEKKRKDIPTWTTADIEKTRKSFSIKTWDGYTIYLVFSDGTWEMNKDRKKSKVEKNKCIVSLGCSGNKNVYSTSFKCKYEFFS